MNVPPLRPPGRDPDVANFLHEQSYRVADIVRDICRSRDAVYVSQCLEMVSELLIEFVENFYDPSAESIRHVLNLASHAAHNLSTCLINRESIQAYDISVLSLDPGEVTAFSTWEN